MIITKSNREVLLRHFEIMNPSIVIDGVPTVAFDVHGWSVGHKSKYSAEIGGDNEMHPLNRRKGSTASSNFVNALISLVSDAAAVGEAAGGKYVAELFCNGDTHFAVFDPKKGTFKAGVLEDSDESKRMARYKIAPLTIATKDKPIPDQADGHHSTVLVLAILPELLKDEEFKENYTNIIDTLTDIVKNKKGISKETVEQLSMWAAVASDNAELRIENKSLRSHLFVDFENLMSDENEVALLKASDLSAGGRYCPKKTLLGRFDMLKVDDGENTDAANSGNSIWDKYVLTNEYDNTNLIPVMDHNAVVVPEYVKTICQHVVASKKFRNFGMRGCAGSGKTMSAEIMAAMLHLPHYIFTCSANTEISDFQGQIIPGLEGDSDNSQGLKYRYAESPLLRAVRDGGVLEIQEPNVIVQPGVIVGLNGIMEPNGHLILPTGEVVKRHPNTIVVITTNTTYEGCRDMNVSLLDRLDLVFDVNTPSATDLAERCKRQTGFKDDTLLAEMAQIVIDISTQMNNEGIEDGTCGLRSLINWAESTMITNDPYSSGLMCLISKTTANADDRSSLEKRLAAASFAKRKRARKI